MLSGRIFSPQLQTCFSSTCGHIKVAEIAQPLSDCPVSSQVLGDIQQVMKPILCGIDFPTRLPGSQIRFLDTIITAITWRNCRCVSREHRTCSSSWSHPMEDAGQWVPQEGCRGEHGCCAPLAPGARRTPQPTPIPKLSPVQTAREAEVVACRTRCWEMPGLGGRLCVDTASCGGCTG